MASDSHRSKSDSGVSKPPRTPSNADEGSTHVTARREDPSSLEDGSTQTSVPTDLDEGSTQTRSLDSSSSDARFASGDLRDGGATTTTRQFDPLGSFEDVDAFRGGWEDAPYDGPSPEEDAEQENEKTVISTDRGTEDDGVEVDELGMLKDGSKFGQFTIVRYVGGGGMGRVYEAKDLALERKVAIKILPKTRAQDEAIVARFLNEAKSAARLNHENIAQVYLFGNVNGVPYIAFEFVEGKNLRDYVREHGRISLDEAIDYVLQAAAALAHAASHNVTHRDVKPSNIIVTPQKRVKLIDMGLARILTPEVEDLTESGVMLGTFDYISPEQARDPRLADVRSDVYSLGCTFYFMLTGNPPFPGGNMLQKLLQHQGDEAPDVRKENREVPGEVAAVLRKMMKKNPDERYQTPDALISDLLEIAEIIGVRVPNRGYPGADSSDYQEKNSFVWRLPGAIAIALFVIVFGSYALFSERNDLVLPEINSPSVGDVQAPVATGETPKSEGDRRGMGETSTVADTQTEPTKSANETLSPTGEPLRTETAETFDVETLGSSELDELYTQEVGRLNERKPEQFIDDSLNWRRDFLADSFTPYEDVRVAAWIRPRSLPDGLDAFSYRFSGDEVFESESAFSAVAYATLGSKPEVVAIDAPTASGVRIVDGIGNAPDTYASLQGALAETAASNGQETVRIELRFNGELSTPSTTFVDRSVEIYAAKDCRPTLTFKPPESPTGLGGESMFLLNSSNVTIRGVSINFDLSPQDLVFSEEWSVFEGEGASSLFLYDSTLTVNNTSPDAPGSPIHSNVSAFRAHERNSRGEETEDIANAALVVHLENVLARGETTLFVAERPGARLEARNCGICVSGPVFHFIDGLREPPVGSQSFSTSIERTVVVGRSSLIRVDSDDATNAAPVFEATATSSIVYSNQNALALLHTLEPESEEAFLEQWKFTGVVALDMPYFYRCRANRSELYQDFPFAFKQEECESAELKNLDSEAASRIVSIPPHAFSESDLANFALLPIIKSASISASGKTTAQAIESDFIVPRFDDDASGSEQ